MSEEKRFVKNYLKKNFPDYFNASYLEVKNKNLIYPIKELQLSLPGMRESERSFDLRLRVGRFFEILGHGIYGGKIGEFFEFSENNDRNHRSEPDITHSKTNLLREVKAVQTGSRLMLVDEQIRKYFLLQTEHKYQVTFEIFRYNVQHLSKIFDENGLEGLVDQLAKRTRAMISIPFSVIYKIHQEEENTFIRRYRDNEFADSTEFSGGGLQGLLEKPEETFKELNINPEFFEFRKKIFPNDVTINCTAIEPFPVLIIKEKDSERELRQLKESVEYDDVPF